MAEEKKCNFDELLVEKEIQQTIQAADPMRADSLNKLQRLRTIRTKKQDRERLRLTKKLGSEHPRVLALQAKIQTNQELTRNLKVEVARAKTKPLAVDPDTWVVHGRVFDNTRQPVPGMKAAIYDKDGCASIDTCGRDITDKTGYFKLIIKDLASDSFDDVVSKLPEQGFLYVLDKDGVILYEGKRPLPIKAGRVQYLEVVLAEGMVGEPSPVTRYLGNSSSKELHDLKNQKPACQIDEIKVDHRVNFKTQKEAMALGYDYCAYCFGKDKSKR